jgi:hypothetical protein
MNNLDVSQLAAQIRNNKNQRVNSAAQRYQSHELLGQDKALFEYMVKTINEHVGKPGFFGQNSTIDIDVPYSLAVTDCEIESACEKIVLYLEMKTHRARYRRNGLAYLSLLHVDINWFY